MTYRDDLEALKSHEASLEQELADTRALIGEHAARRSLLQSVRIASPCKANWDDMVGDERVRFCGQCAKNVYNLSAMPEKDAVELLRTQEKELCVRLYRRADGTVMTADCPVGARKKRVRRLALVAAGGSALAAAAAFVSATTVRMGGVRMTDTHVQTDQVMGEVQVVHPEQLPAVMGTVPPAPPPKPPTPLRGPR
jgi:hypothetical protein